MSYTEERTAFVVGLAAGAARERRRIRRLIAPHLAYLHGQWKKTNCVCRFNPIVGGPVPCDTCKTDDAIHAIDAATRAPKKARTK